MPRATPRVDWTSIWMSKRSLKRHMIWRTSSPGRVFRVSREAGHVFIEKRVGGMLSGVGDRKIGERTWHHTGRAAAILNMGWGRGPRVLHKRVVMP
ncbi:MAG: hypothetical protein BWY06_03453 [Candidatus Latescibacteria bacterium ADurb.Bin168]|nr:MAG: hypothetical protein BWY06_03453 [Candidatus Latescibacteria bacterium ADurb.Bin168]